ncbi:hypothetical protein EPUS_04257 [Endocarpon pusillum Z07020]|uniref:Protein kinase domain-containing protein n=1 Tax=Endocarpon pusillum (strain Z07020 / HMAS-L-300199) TaxID=1263415 RepID=U1G639_ENDPU|nr:uncharacterized protein EPUS_04257 [Endocarpon pusillum Z07020]ERF72822.1 hypothetical protein EPUS_04257 [Endocarpon pusillum Z07020]
MPFSNKFNKGVSLWIRCWRTRSDEESSHPVSTTGQPIPTKDHDGTTQSIRSESSSPAQDSNQISRASADGEPPIRSTTSTTLDQAAEDPQTTHYSQLPLQAPRKPRNILINDAVRDGTVRRVFSNTLTSSEHSLLLKNETVRSSRRKKLYSGGCDWETLVPSRLLCYLIIEFESISNEPFKDERLDVLEFDLNWQDEGAYHMLNNEAQRRLRQYPTTMERQTYRKKGTCKLFRDEQYCFSTPLNEEAKWLNLLSNMIVQFIAKNEMVKFHLEITWTYTASEPPQEASCYAEKVRQSIDAQLVSRKNFIGESYIPSNVLTEIMSETTTEHLINEDDSLKDVESRRYQQNGQFDKRGFVRDVKTKASILLALFVYNKLPLKYLLRLMESDITNVHLGTLPLQRDHCPEGADSVDFGNLVDHQWRFCAHKFPKPETASAHSYDLHRHTILPIQYCNEGKKIGNGAYGEVYKIRIETDHHEFRTVSEGYPYQYQDKCEFFALKKFRGSISAEEFKNEAEVLKELSKQRHKHIVPHFASWSQDGQFSMLFPFADGNLREYWSRPPQRPEVNAQFVTWMLAQFCGLADAVRRIHMMGGYHHDIKPENILYFSDGVSELPTLKIADFGSAKIMQVRSGGLLESYLRIGCSHGTPAYEAPDFFINKGTSSPYDIWTLGCVFLETLLWTFGMLFDEQGSYSRERHMVNDVTESKDAMFWYLDGESYVRWKPFVQRRLDALESRCRQYGVYMSILQTTTKMLHLDPAQRPRAHEVHNDFECIIHRAKDLDKKDWTNLCMTDERTPISTLSDVSGPTNPKGTPVSAKYGYILQGNLYEDERAVLRESGSQGNLSAGNPRPQEELSSVGYNEFLKVPTPHIVVNGELGNTRSSQATQPSDQRPLLSYNQGPLEVRHQPTTPSPCATETSD